MIQVIDKSIIIKLILLLGAIVAICMWVFMQPSSIEEWLRLASTAISITVFILGFISMSSLWRLFWWIFKPLNRLIFPDLNGDWNVTMNSNIKKIAEYHPTLENIPLKSKIKGTITIKQNLLSVVMIFHGKNKYSNSETKFVNLVRMKASGRFKMVYVYENETPRAKSTDEQSHLGAGQVEVYLVDGEPKIEGFYWTNRKWPEGLNTAGTVTMTRIK